MQNRTLVQNVLHFVGIPSPTSRHFTLFFNGFLKVSILRHFVNFWHFHLLIRLLMLRGDCFQLFDESVFMLFYCLPVWIIYQIFQTSVFCSTSFSIQFQKGGFFSCLEILHLIRIPACAAWYPCIILYVWMARDLNFPSHSLFRAFT